MATATPQRPLPGAYFATPAFQRQQANQSSLIRPPVFRAASTTNVQDGQQQTAVANTNNGSAASSPSAQSLEPIERAARTINDMHTQDARFPQLENYVGQGYSADYESPVSEAWKPFQRVRQYPIPDRIFDQINQAQLNYQIGLFAELNHAWITIDNALYLWDYTHPNPEIIGFEDQPNAITYVKLTRPRAGVFVGSISHMLVVATASDIYLIGVAAQASAEGVNKVSLYQTRMQVSIKGINVTCIEGSSATGRIFFGGSSSNDVYELTYQQEEKWFANKCAKICHTSKGLASILPALPFSQAASQEHVKQIVADDSRNLLYVLSSKSTIRVFQTRSANSLPFVLDRTFGQLRTMISHIVAQSDLLQPSTSIISISPIVGNEAARVALLATTSTGIRIYLSSTSGGYYQGYSATAPPTSMQVQHVRFPPSPHDAQQAVTPTPSSQALAYRNGPAIDLNSTTLSPSYCAVRYAPGYFICVKRGPDQGGAQDRLFVIAPESGRIAQSTDQNQVTRFLETVWSDILDGPVQGDQGLGLVTPIFAAANTPYGFGNELAVQFDKPASQFAVLTNRGIHIIRRRRLVDIFADSVRSIADESFEDASKRFIKSYGRIETCATALAVACCEATSVTADARITSINDRDVTESAARAFKEHGGKPTFDENMVYDNGAPGDNVRLSPRHDGLALYISRVVRSVWRSLILKAETKPIGGLNVSPGVPLSKLRDVQQTLERLHKFLSDNKTTIEGLTSPDTVARSVSRNEELAQQAEHRAMHALLKLISNIIEGIAFVLVLFEERVDEILLSFPETNPVRGQIQQLTFEALFCSREGKSLAKELVKAIVNLNIANGSNVETVAGALQRKCGSFCSPEDVIIFKAQEQLNKALAAGANSESARVLLNESLKLFQKVAKHLTMEHLQGAIEQFVNMAFYAGAIRLLLEVAQEKDRGNRALSWINDGSPAGDARETAYHQRTQCYQLIHNIINAVDQAFVQDQSAADPATSITGRRRAEAYEEINSSNDEVFQTHLYDWYLSQGWNERLLEISSPYVIKYLTRKSEGDLAHADLLWRYNAHYNNYLAAAKVQLDLAKSSFDIPLDRRIEYLSWAKTNASTKIGGMGQVDRTRQSRQELLREASDLLDLANIQGELLQRLKTDPRMPQDRRGAVITELDGRILPMDELYNSYADQAEYHDLCLLIYQAADHRTAQDVISTWSNLISKVHDDAGAAGQEAYMNVAETIRDMGTKLNLSETIFPISALLPIFLTYQQREVRASPKTWVVDTLYDISVPPENLVVVLENMFYTQDPPFQGQRGRAIIGSLIVHVAERWLKDSGRAGGLPFGGEDNAVAVSETLRNVMEQRVLDADTTERARLLRATIDQVLL